LGESGSAEESAAASASPQASKPQRFLVWVDSVGGFLVCLNSEIILGQAHPGARVDLPIQADIRRQHAKIVRQGEGYLLQPLGPPAESANAASDVAAAKVSVEGQAICEPTLLSDGDEIELGDGVRLRFRKPHALSASARLEMVSRHRTQPFVDGVILMAESCVLGPKWQNHVVCREWKNDLVLYRQDDKLFCRAMESVEIDGALCEGRGRISTHSRILGDDFSLSLEPLA
jgi:hypothetical protein